MPLLKNIAEIRMGVTFRGRDATRPTPDGPYTLIRIGAIDQHGCIALDEVISIRPNDPVSKNLILRSGDVLFPNRGTRTTAATFLDLGKPAIVGSQFFLIRPDPDRIAPDYLAWFLRTDFAHQYFETCRTGSNVRLIQRSDLAELSVATPPLEIQAGVVAASDCAREERRLSQKLAELRWKLSNQQLLEFAQTHST